MKNLFGWCLGMGLFVLMGCSSPQTDPEEVGLIVPTPVEAFKNLEQPSQVPPVIVDGEEVEAPAPTWTPLPTNTPGPDSSCQQPAGWTTYTVAAGDTLSSIARSAGSTVEELTEVNCLADPTRIEVAQVLFVPQVIVVPSPSPTAEATPTPEPTEVVVLEPAMVIDFFRVNPSPAYRNEEVTISWQLTGDGSFELMYTTLYDEEVILRSGDEQGEYTTRITLPDVPGPIQFTLSVRSDNGRQENRIIQLLTQCPYSYLIGDATNQLGTCPRSNPVVANGAYQPFVGGFMIWHKGHDGKYTIGVFADDGRVIDLSREYYDGGEITWGEAPPTGLYQPIRGFGHVWVNSNVVRDELSWAVANEQPYTVSVQQLDIRLDASTFIGDTYLTLPNGQVLRYTAPQSTNPGRWMWVN
ncbi:MAG: LysM peptidoglycan-binding domain-containing protein [Chloroflexota bacterium]